jgi:hypothetical protein
MIGKKLHLTIYQRIFHDISKFSPTEWFSYVKNFYNDDGTKRSVRDSTGYYDPKKCSNTFEYGWLHHAHNNKHHWQYWILVDYDSTKILEMPLKYVREMVADWYAAGMAQNHDDNPTFFYNSNKHKMILNNYSRSLAESYLRFYFKQ